MQLKRIGVWRRRILLASTLFLISILCGTTQLKQFRNASSVFLDSQWKKVVNFFGNDDFYVYVFGCILSIQIPFWTVSSLFVFLDYFNWPKWVRKYKVQPGTNEPVDLNRLFQAVKVVLINQWLISNPAFVLSYFVKQLTNTMPEMYELPTPQRFLFDLFVLMVIDEIAQYYLHRLIHHPKLYVKVHKKHHEWTAPIALSFAYSTKTEYVINMIPVALGPMLMNPHLVTLWIWYNFVHLRGINNHTGYQFPWLPASEHHDYHHMASHSCYGRTIVMDWLHGTDKGFRTYQARKDSKARQGQENSAAQVKIINKFE